MVRKRARRILARRVSGTAVLTTLPIVALILINSAITSYKREEMQILFVLPPLLIQYKITSMIAHFVITTILACLSFGIFYVLFEKHNGIIGDFEINQRNFLSFSICLSLAVYLSIIINAIFPVWYAGTHVSFELMLINSCLIAPFFEEISFRAPLLFILSIREENRVHFILFGRENYDQDVMSLTTIILFSFWFGITHYLFGWSLSKIIQMFIFGVLVSIIATRLGIFGAFALHLLFNTIGISLIYRVSIFGFLIYMSMLFMFLSLLLLAVEYIRMVQGGLC